MKAVLLFILQATLSLIVFSQGIEKTLGSISEFDRTLQLDVKVLTSYDGSFKINSLNSKNKDYISDTFSMVSKMLAPSNIKISVRDRGFQFYEEALKGTEKLNIGYYTDYFAFKYDRHDLFIVFEDLSEEKVFLHYHQGSMCLANSILIVDVGIADADSPEQLAFRIAYGIGRVMGFTNIEEGQNCSCGYKNKNSCIMNSPTFTDVPTFPKVFDSCNIDKSQKRILSLRCLHREFDSKRLYSKCGDGIVDSTEDCDCGDKQLCKDFTDKNKCCDSKCMFKKEIYECTDGDCCDKCMLSTKVCRSSIGECDHSEYCDGKSKRCPRYDLVLPNYDICRNNQGFCYNGNCMNLDYMCKYAYNDSRVFFSRACVSFVNKILNTGSQFQGSKLIRSFFHNKSNNMCSYFVCGLKSKLDIQNAYYFKKNGTHCIVQTETDNDVLSQAPQYMPCMKRGSKGKNFCNKGQCMDSKSIENCVSGNCKNFNKRVKMENIFKKNIEQISTTEKKNMDDNKKEQFLN